jgi:hypothetical protein
MSSIFTLSRLPALLLIRMRDGNTSLAAHRDDSVNPESRPLDDPVEFTTGDDDAMGVSSACFKGSHLSSHFARS